MNPLIKIRESKLTVSIGYVLVDRESGKVLAEGKNQFELTQIGNTYTAKTGKPADIRQKEGNEIAF